MVAVILLFGNTLTSKNITFGVLLWNFSFENQRQVPDKFYHIELYQVHITKGDNQTPKFSSDRY
jgi:hypothetical protein